MYVDIKLICFIKGIGKIFPPLKLFLIRNPICLDICLSIKQIREKFVLL